MELSWEIINANHLTCLFPQPLLVPKLYIQPENFLLLLCVLIKNNVQQSWERWSTWSIWSIWWWSIYSHTHGLLQFNSFNTHSWVIPPNSAISPHHLSPSTQQQQWYAHVNPTNLMGSSFCYSSNLWLMIVAMYAFESSLLPTSNWIQKISRDEVKMQKKELWKLKYFTMQK
jgi:hypothetical protein